MLSSLLKKGKEEERKKNKGGVIEVNGIQTEHSGIPQSKMMHAMIKYLVKEQESSCVAGIVLPALLLALVTTAALFHAIAPLFYDIGTLQSPP